MLRAVKIRVYPDQEQAQFLDRQFGAVRFVYNKALAIKRHCYKVRRAGLSARRDLKPLLAVAKRSRRYSWLAEFDAISLQQACINLDRAFTNFFEHRARFPRFKSKRGPQSSYHCTGRIEVGKDWIAIPKCPGRIPAVVHRAVAAELKSITLTKTPTGKYFASCLFEDGEVVPKLAAVVPADAVVGIDVGLTHVVIESTGCKTGNPRFVTRSERNLRRKQKSLSRKRKGSKNRAKARHIVASAHERVANARGDFQHKIARRLVDENQAIIVETLNIKNMQKNRCLAKAIGDAGWHSLRTKIAYKAARGGKHFVALDQWAATSKTCSCCGFRVAELPLSVREWTCDNCDTLHDR
ncbi:MAG TPA: RNA-guided endonuclease TnpB family protein, partial [Xanthobacteraceae bacterium]